MDDGKNHKKAKSTKKCVTKQKLMFHNYKDLTIKRYIDLRKDLEVITMLCTQKK